MDDEKVNSLVVFLSSPNRKAEEYVETVMDMVRELSRYKHELKETAAKRDELGSRLDREFGLKSRRDTMGFDEAPHARDYDPRHVTIPSNARSVEIKF